MAVPSSGRPILSDRLRRLVNVERFINQRTLSDAQYAESNLFIAFIKSTLPTEFKPVLVLPSLPAEPAATTVGAAASINVGIKPRGFVLPPPVIRSVPTPRAIRSSRNALN